jgi:hypothetical protein
VTRGYVKPILLAKDTLPTISAAVNENNSVLSYVRLS